MRHEREASCGYFGCVAAHFLVGTQFEGTDDPNGLHLPRQGVRSMHGSHVFGSRHAVARHRRSERSRRGCRMSIGGQLRFGRGSRECQILHAGVKSGLFCSTPGVAVARAVPRKVAMDMLLTGEPISAQQALNAGLVTRIVPEDQVEKEALAVAEKICDLSRPVSALGKSFFYMQVEKDRLNAYRKRCLLQPRIYPKSSCDPKSIDQYYRLIKIVSKCVIVD